MAASANDMFMEIGSPGTATTLSAPGYTAGGTTITVGSTSNWPTTTGTIFAIDEIEIVDGKEVQIQNSYNEFEGTVDTATTITNVNWVDGDGDRNYSAGSSTRVYIPVSAERENRLARGMAVSHSQDGHIATTGVATFTDHIDMADGKAIRDGNDNEVIKISQTASAVNEITVKNAATGNGAEIQATGGDTDIDIELVPKGAGNVTNGSYNIDWWEEIGRTTLGVAGDSISVTIPARKYLKVIISVTPTGGNIIVSAQFNGDTGSNYSRRAYLNDTMSTTTSTTGVGPGYSAAAISMDVVLDIVNIATKEKFITGNSTHIGAAGAATAPSNSLFYCKWVNTTDQITTINVVNGSTGDYAIGSEVVVLGHN
jgi:hypothetical protein